MLGDYQVPFPDTPKPDEKQKLGIMHPDICNCGMLAVYEPEFL